MYLARIQNHDGDWNYFIRESYRNDDGIWCSRTLFDLGITPDEYIHYEGSAGFYFDDAIEQALAEKGVNTSQDELEDVLWMFIDPEIRRLIKDFSRSSHSKFSNKTRLTRKKRKELYGKLHIFDRARSCFLKFGQINMEGLIDKGLACYKVLLNKSRDEIEQMFSREEARLRPWERRGYLYAVFDIAGYFGQKMTRFIPDAQPLEDIDRYFLDSVCRLNRDRVFFMGVEHDGDLLHPYLQRYLFMYFDWAYSQSGPRPDVGKTPVSTDTLMPYLKIMHITSEEYKDMDEEELSKIFRKLALQMHPDKGGGHDAFIRLQEAYQMLLKRKTWV